MKSPDSLAPQFRNRRVRNKLTLMNEAQPAIRPDPKVAVVVLCHRAHAAVSESVLDVIGSEAHAVPSRQTASRANPEIALAILQKSSHRIGTKSVFRAVECRLPVHEADQPLSRSPDPKG